MKKNKPRKRQRKAVSKEEVTLGIVALPAPTVALHPNWGHPYPIPAFWECSLAVPQLCCHPSLQGSRLSRPGPSRSLAQRTAQPARTHYFQIIFAKSNKEQKSWGKREARRSNHLHFSDSFMHLLQAGFAEALYQVVQSSPVGSAAWILSPW